MNAKHHRRHMSREEREDRARLKSASVGAKWRQTEETRWGRVGLILEAFFFPLCTIWIGWRLVKKFSAGRYPDSWTVFWEATFCLFLAWKCFRIFREFFAWIRGAKKPVTIAKADSP